LREVPAGMEQNSFGLDVHARSVVACGLDDVTGELSEAPAGAGQRDRSGLAASAGRPGCGGLGGRADRLRAYYTAGLIVTTPVPDPEVVPVLVELEVAVPRLMPASR